LNISNILYLSYDGLSDPLGQSQVLPYLVGLSKKGFEITIISFEKEKRFKSGRATIDNICEKHAIDWHPLKYSKRPPVISTLWDIRKMDKLVGKLHGEKNFQLIHCRSYITSLLGLKMKRKYEIPFIFDMRGLWADERVEGNIWNLKNPIYKSIFNYFKKKEKRFIQDANSIVSLTKSAIPYINKIIPNATIKVIPTAVDLNLFDPKKINQVVISRLKADLGISDQFVLGYSGSLGTWYLLKEMLLFFKTLLNIKPAAVLLVLSQDDPAELYSLVKEFEIPEDSIAIRSANRNEMPSYISLFDLSVMFIKPSFSKTASSPTKLGELMAMGVPVICNSGVGDVKEIVEKYNAGIMLEELNETSFISAIHTIQNEKYYDLHQMRIGCQEYYDLEKGVEKYSSIYTSLINY
jgi:glycosyltransferase involved in cell wall biosynthesis